MAIPDRLYVWQGLALMAHSTPTVDSHTFAYCLSFTISIIRSTYCLSFTISIIRSIEDAWRRPPALSRSELQLQFRLSPRQSSAEPVSGLWWIYGYALVHSRRLAQTDVLYGKLRSGARTFWCIGTPHLLRPGVLRYDARRAAAATLTWRSCQTRGRIWLYDRWRRLDLSERPSCAGFDAHEACEAAHHPGEGFAAHLYGGQRQSVGDGPV